MDNTINTGQYQLRAATLNDADAVARVINASKMADTGEDWLTADELLNAWKAPEFDCEKVTCIALDDAGEMVGYGALYDRTPHTMKWADIDIHPDHRDGPLPDLIADALLNIARERVVLADPGVRVRTMIGAFEGADWLKALAKKRGYEHMRTFFEMRIDLADDIPEPGWAEGIRVTDATEVDLRDIYRVIYSSFKDHFGTSSERPFDVAVESWIHHFKGYPTYQPEFMFTAMDGDQPVGVSACVPGLSALPEVGYVMTLGVLASHRRKGIALALLHHTFRAFRAAGLKIGALDVDGASITNATRLYKKAGMHVHRREESYALILRDGRETVKLETGEDNDA